MVGRDGKTESGGSGVDLLLDFCDQRSCSSWAVINFKRHIDSTNRGLVTVLESLKAQRSDPLPVPTISVSPELTDWISKSKEEIRVVLAATKTKAAADAQKFLESLRISDPTPAGHSKVLGIECALRIPVRWIPKGRFRMGSSIQELGRFPGETEDEVILTHGYFLTETECTEEQCDAIMARNPIKAKSEGN